NEYLLWLSLVALCFAYNAVVIPLRSSFVVQKSSNLSYWILFDYVCDLLYLMDIVLVKTRLQTVQNGIRITDVGILRKYYLKRWVFLTDLFSLLPLDLLYLYPPLRFKPILRLPRLFKIYDIVSMANRTRVEFKHAMDSAVQACKQFGVPDELQDKVRQWFTYAWKEQRALSESDALCKLPINLQVDMAISVNYETLRKVELFRDCEKGLLRDLMLKLKSVIYLPGDYICRKNEISLEMYIVNKGTLLVLAGGERNELLSVLGAGSVFGEIGLLAMRDAFLPRKTIDFTPSEGPSDLPRIADDGSFFLPE
ncbi:hypothetical protein M514_02132, partial [Trichuris suis]